jgi:hypothetical protein
MGRNQHSFTPERKAQLIEQIVEIRLTGKSFFAISKELGIARETVEKYFFEAMELVPMRDPSHVLVGELERISKAMDKCTTDYHGGKCRATDFVAMSAHYLKYSGVDKHIDSIAPARTPELLKIEVEFVEVEMPPEPTEITETEEITNAAVDDVPVE